VSLLLNLKFLNNKIIAMKKIFFYAFLLLATSNTLFAQKNKDKDDNDSNWNQSGWGNGQRITGQGQKVKEDRNITGFTGVESGIAADIILKQGSSFKVTIEGQKNILDVLKTELKGTSLKISFEKGVNIRYKENLKIYVEAPNFETLGMSGSGDVRADGTLKGSKLRIGISGSGNFNLNLDYTELDLGISGSGDVMLDGKSDKVTMGVSGSGDIKAGNLKAQSVKCSVSGSGNINCNAQKSLEAYVSGSGDIKYSGNPSSVKTKVTGSGDIDAQ
jgi:Putative auto-transporter adhesin, head GIN domain